jgi:enoyl-CoA hydratase
MVLLSRLARPAATALRRPFAAANLPRFSSSSSSTTYENILLSTPRPGVAQITLNRPKALNALSSALFVELNAALKDYEADSTISTIVLTGSERAFAAGADIKEMATLTFSEAYTNNFIAPWSTITTLRKPVIAAVSGHALGGGCELAMMCDILYATKTANFGQPEIKLGTIPGAGGSQRLTRAIGKSKAMELILTGNSFSGVDAEKYGLVAKVFETHEELINGALDTAEKIARYSKVAVVAAKEVVNKSQELSLREGVEYERRVFHALFGSNDQKIGMKAFAEKKKAEWTHS